MLEGGRWLSVPMRDVPDVHVPAIIVRPWWMGMAVVVEASTIPRDNSVVNVVDLRIESVQRLSECSSLRVIDE